VYQQASAERSELWERDPENRYYWRMNRRRLDFESLRDALLSASGQLDASRLGGPSASITDDRPSLRRTLYAFTDRQNLPGLFRVFDVALPDTHAPKRFQTTVPQQALFLMNSPFVLRLADQLASSCPLDPASPAGGIVALYRQVLARDPTSSELQQAEGFVRATAATGAHDRAGSQLAHVLLICNEFLFLD
jgi:hypothetical protein